MDEETVVPPDNGLLLSAEKKWAIKPWKHMENLWWVLYQGKQAHLKEGYELYDSKYMTFWKTENFYKAIE